MPVRPVLVFRRTARGDAQVRNMIHPLPLHMAQLLLLFEGPQSVADLRSMIDEPWLPEALIGLERRRLIERVDQTTTAAGPDGPRSVLEADTDRPAAPEPGLAQRRERTRILFLRHLGALGNDMAQRIDRCRSDEELNELMPQVNALVEAIAGRGALTHFRDLVSRDH